MLGCKDALGDYSRQFVSLKNWNIIIINTSVVYVSKSKVLLHVIRLCDCCCCLTSDTASCNGKPAHVKVDGQGYSKMNLDF